MAFKNLISSEEELRDIIGNPGELAANKVISYLDKNCNDFISKSPFLVLSTSNTAGACDASPRGDSPGFVLTVDEKHLVIPERPGNRRIDSIKNILENPHVGLIFVIPGLEETLRINGKASITRDPELLSRMEVKGRSPLVAIGIEVEEAFIHCAKAFKRSGLWNHQSWLEKEKLPHIAKVLAEHASLPDYSTEKVSEGLKESYTERLY
ncbi:pyridoxamine 5'-phosphate oxidase family protein [Pseudalkalibacillus caeni]|uniref:Pyridoxamine 5'-phosphate oxidase family protein n=1 Tax=Exobacillus caeni TaxID=2574798 RepID=A0A5R9F6S0_9BACL|nr:pyridoxamine 5'-phosphate oxidase family protein [Pseudalkalibacillus caeni]TLS35475.1 pyridoxamine 5'-phosphate oxidase family protein [Pseudalkalibacillus caeni]